MISRDLILWEVDPQADFMLPGGKLYVPGAEKLLPNIRRLTNAAREDRVFLVSHGCVHAVNDPEFTMFPPHCVRGTPGAKFVPEALAAKFVTIPNESTSALPDDLSQLQQIILEKQTLDVFESRHAVSLLERFGRNAEFMVFGVVTEYCVYLAAKGLLDRGRSVFLVQDAIETLKPEAGQRAITELQTRGAQLISTDAALARVEGFASAKCRDVGTS